MPGSAESQTLSACAYATGATPGVFHHEQVFHAHFQATGQQDRRADPRLLLAVEQAVQVPGVDAGRFGERLLAPAACPHPFFH